MRILPQIPLANLLKKDQYNLILNSAMCPKDRFLLNFLNETYSIVLRLYINLHVLDYRLILILLLL